MTSLDDRREAEIAKYREAYTDQRYRMKEWRQEILREWLAVANRRCVSYLDVGCGRGESLTIARDIGMDARGCEVVESLCDGSDVDLIPGGHVLPYRDDAFDAVSCCDVLEHVLEEDVPVMLRELSRVAGVALLLGISGKPGPLHITCHPPDWWEKQVLDVIPNRYCFRAFEKMIPPVKQPYVWLCIE